MSEAHDALLCIGSKNYINDKQRIKLTDNHYFINLSLIRFSSTIASQSMLKIFQITYHLSYLLMKSNGSVTICGVWG